MVAVPAPPLTCMVAVPTGGPVGVAEGLSDVVVVVFVVVARERVEADSGAVGLPSIVVHPVATTAMTAATHATPFAELSDIPGAYVGRHIHRG
jgi:hypothetical protein